MPIAKDITGERCGKIVAVRLFEKHRSGHRWLWQCDCGETKVLHPHSARKTGHCGCLTREHFSVRSTKHGAAGTREYKAWAGMKDRCLNTNNPHYTDYGGRGIEVCKQWIESYQSFLDDMGQRPVGMTLERIDNALGYCKENCRWATRKEQQRNRRANVTCEIGGLTKCLKEWCEVYGIGYTTVRGRMGRGWGMIDAITTPADRQYRNRRSIREISGGIV